MESKFPGLFFRCLGIKQPHFLLVHLHDILKVVGKLPLVKGPNPDHNLNAVRHRLLAKIYNLEFISRLMIQPTIYLSNFDLDFTQTS